MADENKKAVEKLRRLLNTNFNDDESSQIELTYSSNTDESLLTVNK